MGFDCALVKPPPEGVQAECPICLLLISEPHQVTCCGKRFCQTCIKSIKSSTNKACPTCNTKVFGDFPDKALKQSLYALKVHCSYKEDGCEWTGELGRLEAHLNKNPQPENKLKGCLYMIVSCDFLYIGCKVTPYRKDIPEHLKEALHTHMSLMVSEHSRIATINEKLVRDHRRSESEYAQLVVEHATLANKHKQLDSTYNRLAAEQASQARSTVELIRKLNENLAQLKSENNQLKSRVTVLELTQAQTPAAPAPVSTDSHQPLPQTKPLFPQKIETIKISPSDLLTMKNVEQYKRDKNWWYSPPVFTHHQGYKICLGVYPNGLDFGQGTHISVYIYFVKGEFDDYLTWPFRGVISVQMINLNQKGGDHHTFVVIYDETVNPEFCQRVESEERSKRGWGTPMFIAYSQLKPRYLQGNMLQFKITGGEAQV